MIRRAETGASGSCWGSPGQVLLIFTAPRRTQHIIGRVSKGTGLNHKDKGMKAQSSKLHPDRSHAASSASRLPAAPPSTRDSPPVGLPPLSQHSSSSLSPPHLQMEGDSSWVRLRRCGEVGERRVRGVGRG